MTICAYWGVWKGFFQQDEWAGLGGFYSLSGLSLGNSLIDLYLPMFKSGVAHFLPFLPITNFVRYTLFDLNYPLYALSALVTHVIAVISVYILISRISSKKIIAFVAALLFSLSASSSQAVIWVGTSIPTQCALIFSCWSIIKWFEWLKNKKQSSFIWSILFLILAIGYKETALFLLIFLPVVHFIVKKKISKQVFMPLVGISLSYILLRIIVLTTSSNLGNALLSTFTLFKNACVAYLQVAIKGVSQTLVPLEAWVLVGKKIVKIITYFRLPIEYSNVDVFVENTIVKVLLYIVGLLLIGTFVYKKKYIYLVFLLSSFMPLAFISTGELQGTFISQRNLYIPSIPVFALVSEMALSLSKRKKLIAYLFIASLVCVHLVTLREQISSMNEIGLQRKSILEQIREEYPKLPQKAVFYIESDRSYYNIPLTVKIPPFQSGFGQTLLVWYFPNAGFSKNYFKDRFLWEIDSQGYKETDSRGFGFFRELDLLKETIKQYNLSTESIIAFRWNSTSNTLENITKEIQEKLNATH